ncbi:transposase [Thiolapillus sp.]|uniref:transposase n=1 Tax=Thiolapillus sp. TaxID=2017437 RepID=UPI003AF6262D
MLGDQDGWGTNRLSKAESILGTGMSQNLSRGRRHACYTNARMEGLNSLFQAARARARGYRNNRTFITMIYMIASPAGSILKSI